MGIGRGTVQLLLVAACFATSGDPANCAEPEAPLETAKRLAASKEQKERVQALQWLKALAKPGTAPGDEALARYAGLCLRFHAEGDKNALAEAKRAFTDLKENSHSRWGLKATVGLLRVMAAEGKPEDAAKGFDRFLLGQGKDDAFIEAAYYLGCLHAESKDFKRLQMARQSLDYANKLLALHKNYYQGDLTDETIRGKLAWVNQQIHEMTIGPLNSAFAKAEAAKNAGKYDEAIKLYDWVVAEGPAHALADLSGLRICECLHLKGEQDAAIKQVRAFLAQKPQGPYRGQAHVLLGDILLEHFFDGEAAEHEYAAVLWPGHYDVRTGRTQKPPSGSLNATRPDESWGAVLADGHERYGLCLYMRREFDDAARHFEEELRLRPMRPFGKGQIASHMQCLLQMCRERKYPVYYHQHVMVGDRRAQTLLFLASAYAEMGRHEKALKMFQRVQGEEFAKSAGDLHRAYARMEEGECLRLLLREAEAIKVLGDFDKKYAAAPFAPMALMEKARIYLTLDDKKAARGTYQEVFSRYPNSQEAAQAIYLSGYTHYVMKEWAEALACFELLVSRHPECKQAKMVRSLEIPQAKAALAAPTGGREREGETR